MSFLNAILLGGLAAAAIPLVIHLLNRRRFRVVRWGATAFLEDILRTNRRRLRLEEILLLLLRMAIPALLALGMARPVLTGWSHLARHAPGSYVILLDNSLSMQAGDAARSAFDRAREEAGRILDGLPRGSDAAVVGLAGPLAAPAEPSVDRGALRRSLEGERAGYGAADPAAGLRAAAALFASAARQADRELIVLSDFQRASWGEGEAGERARAAARLAALPLRPRVVLFPVDAGARDNVSVVSVDVSRQLLGVGQPVLARVNLRNHGAAAVRDLRVRFRVDGAEREASQVSLAPGETGQLLFTHRFDRPGSHWMEARAEADRLEGDNAARVAVLVLDRLPVAILSGDVSADPLRSETAYLELALQPFPDGRPGVANLIRARTVDAEQARPDVFADARVAILANVPRLDDRVADALAAFARDGGGVLVLPGDRARADWYNARLHAGGAGLLPLPLAALADGAAGEGAAPAAIVGQHFTHPALALFNDPRFGSLGGAQIRTWHRLAADGGAAEAAARDATVIARLDSGDPFLVERGFGAGRVILAAAPADADWSNLPLRPFYLPLMQEIVAYLASTIHPPRNVDVGRRLAALLPASEAGREARFVDPEGAAHPCIPVARGARAACEFEDTGRPGLYELVTAGGETNHFVVRVPPAESDLATLPAAGMDALAKDLGATVARSGDAYAQQARERRFGRELWRPLLALLATALFAERLLVRRFSARRET